MQLNNLIDAQDYDSLDLAWQDFHATVADALLDANDPLWVKLVALSEGHEQVQAVIMSEVAKVEDVDDLAFITRTFDYPAVARFFGDALASATKYLWETGYYEDDSLGDYLYDRATGN